MIMFVCIEFGRDLRGEWDVRIFYYFLFIKLYGETG
jgi:hypothetical protein